MTNSILRTTKLAESKLLLAISMRFLIVNGHIHQPHIQTQDTTIIFLVDESVMS